MASEKPFTIELQKTADYQELLTDDKTWGMRSGRVYLKPDEECGKHSTGKHEEMLVFLEGIGTAFIDDVETMVVGAGKIAYVPPETIHNIKNTSDKPLVYIYCVAPVNTKN